MPDSPSPSALHFQGCERGVTCHVEASCFTPHPWSSTHETCLYASAYMRAEHLAEEISRALSGEPSYREAVEVMMKVSLLKRDRHR